MKTQLTESEIEDLALQELAQLGYTYIPGPSLLASADGIPAARPNTDAVVLPQHLRAAAQRLNPGIAEELREQAIKELLRVTGPELLTNNETTHRMLTEGIKVTTVRDGHERGELVFLIDFTNPERNEFLAVNQLVVTENGRNRRPDIVLFVNGLPLVVIELKNAADERATIRSAFTQIQNYKHDIPSLFAFNSLCVISDGLEAKAGSLSAGFSRFSAWKTSDGITEDSRLIPEMETIINGLLRPAVLLEMVRYFTVFEKDEGKDKTTGLVKIQTVKKVAAYHQYYAVLAAVKSTLRAAGYADYREFDAPSVTGTTGDHPTLPTVADQAIGDRRGGVVWHTQGSGKSLSMVFFAGKIVQVMDNPTLVVITDRNDLDDQLFDTFSTSQQLLRQTPRQAEDRQHLKQLLAVEAGGIVFTTIQKFSPEEGNVFDELSDRSNIVVIIDEAHRSQYGFEARNAKVIDRETGEQIGMRTVYGHAKYLRDALPQATYLGFTGTPIEKDDVNTPAVFGNYVDIYDIAQAVEDGATVKIYYESRLAKVQISEEGRELIQDLDEELGELEEHQKTKSKWTQVEALIGADQRIQRVAADIVAHFEARQEVFEGKVMVVAMSRRIAAELYAAIERLRPDWHDDDLDKGAMKVVMTSSSSDPEVVARHRTTKSQRKQLAGRMKDPTDPLKLVIVRDMWLTGFDAPSMHTLYIDKPIKGHNLMQAIARVNRVYKDKPGGLIVDYLGIAADLKSALNFYAESGGTGDPAEQQEQAVSLMLEKIDVVSAMLHGIAYENYFTADTRTKLQLILQSEDHILGLDDGKERFLREVTVLAKAFAIAIPHPQAIDVKEEVGFFQAIKARLVKFDSTGEGRSDAELETTIRQVIDQALVSEQVVDVFDAAGIKKPDISILSDEFLAELRDKPQQNVAVETLKKLLKDEIRVRTRTNVVQGKSLMEMRENTLRRYHSKAITAVEVIDELIKVANEIKAQDRTYEELGITQYEYAFYTAVAANDSARELMEKEKLKELAVVLYERVRKNATIDWTVKEDVRAKLRVLVKRTLRQYGYPPDMQKLATETVLRQAELLALKMSIQD